MHLSSDSSMVSTSFFTIVEFGDNIKTYIVFDPGI